MLDFRNDPADILAEFQKYYQTADLAAVSDPNLVYTLMEALADERIYSWDEVEAFAAASSVMSDCSNSLSNSLKKADLLSRNSGSSQFSG